MPRVSRERRRSIIDRPTRSLFILLYSFLLEEKKTSTAIFLFQSIHFFCSVRFLFASLSYKYSSKKNIYGQRLKERVQQWNCGIDRNKERERKRENDVRNATESCWNDIKYSPSTQAPPYVDTLSSFSIVSKKNSVYLLVLPI